MRPLCLSAVFLAALVNLSATVVPDTTVVGEWNFDEDLDGWVLYEDSEPGTVSFDATDGNPDVGSLRLSLLDASDRVLARGPCFYSTPGTEFVLHAQVREEATSKCEIVVYTFPEPNCTGSPAIPSTFQIQPPVGDWEDQIAGSFHSVEFLPEDGYASPMVGMFGSPTPNVSCWLDSVTLERTPIPSVPMVSWNGIGVLSFVIALAGLALTRKARRRSRSADR